MLKLRSFKNTSSKTALYQNLFVYIATSLFKVKCPIKGSPNKVCKPIKECIGYMMSSTSDFQADCQDEFKVFSNFQKLCKWG